MSSRVVCRLEVKFKLVLQIHGKLLRFWSEPDRSSNDASLPRKLQHKRKLADNSALQRHEEVGVMPDRSFRRTAQFCLEGKEFLGKFSNRS